MSSSSQLIISSILEFKMCFLKMNLDTSPKIENTTLVSSTFDFVIVTVVVFLFLFHGCDSGYH